MQYYSLDDAAKKLGISIDDFRKRMATEWKTLRRFPDGPTLRFQARDIDELARKMGRSSDPELQLGDAPSGLTEMPAGKVGAKKTDETLYLPDASEDDFIPLALSDDKKEKSGSDSDVKLEKTAGGSVRPVAGKDEPTEVLEISDAARTKSSFDVKLDPPKNVTRKHTPIASEFELSLSNDSDEFDLELTDDSDEVPLGGVVHKGPRSGDSGINLQDPADSGISLEKESSEFELQLEPDAKSAKPAAIDDSDSEFELTLDDEGGSNTAAAAFEAGEQKDIFETDFELPAIDDSGSEVKSGADTDLEESDFDLEVGADDEESASEVVALEDDDAEDDLQPVDDDERPIVRNVAAASTEWGILPVLGLAPSVLVMFFVGLMGYELLHSMWAYHSGGKVSGPIVSTVAGMFGDLPK